MIWQPLCYADTCPWLATENGKMEPINGLVGAASRGMNTVGWLQMSRHAMLSKQCVLYTHTAPYLGVRVKQAVSLVG